MSEVTSTVCQRLQAADQAYHDLMLGRVARSIQDENGESISYTQTNADMLLAYIRQLAPLCPTYVPVALGVNGVRQPLRFFF